MIGRHTGIADPSTGDPALGNNSKPHIDIWHSSNAALNGAPITSQYFAVTWQKYNQITGKNEIWGVDGTVDGLTINQEFRISDEGIEPDVVAVTATVNYASPPGSTFRAYTSYLDPLGEKLHVREWRYGTTAPFGLAPRTLETVTNPDQLAVPRISGPMRYDYDNPSNIDPLCAVVVNDNRGTNNVSAYRMYHTSITPDVTAYADITNHTNPDGFSNRSEPAIMPVITGVGHIASNLAGEPAYMDYLTEFYSEYDFAGTSGDYYAFGIRTDVTNSDPVLAGNTHYYQVYDTPPDNVSPTHFDMSTRPALAVATSNNSGHDLLSAFFAGDAIGQQHIKVVLHGPSVPPYSFKPGRPAGVENTTAKDYAVYPNPVTDVLNIAQANGAAYTVTDAVGRVLSTGTLQGDKAQVSTAAFTPGMYILTISKDGRTEKVKFVKQ